MFGHAASSHTVITFLSFNNLSVDLKNFDVGAFTLKNQMRSYKDELRSKTS